MWLADTSIRRPVIATMFLMALVVLGIVSYPSIGVDLFPKVDFPIVNVTTRLIGASPEIMDIDVTDKIEESVNTINGVKTISSQSVEGVSGRHGGVRTREGHRSRRAGCEGEDLHHPLEAPYRHRRTHHPEGGPRCHAGPVAEPLGQPLDR